MLIDNDEVISEQYRAIKSLLDLTSNRLKSTGIQPEERQQAGFSFENFNTTASNMQAAAGLSAKADRLLNDIASTFGTQGSTSRTIVAEHFGNLTPARERMAREMAAISSFTKEELIHRRIQRHNSDLTNGIDKNSVNFISESASTAFSDAFFNPVGNPEYSAESYTEPKNDVWQSTTAVYNLLGVDACPFANAFFETIVVPIEQAGIITNITLPSLRYRNRNYTPNGKRVEFQRKLFTDLYFTPSTVLDFSDTKLFPVYRQSSDATLDTTANFVSNSVYSVIQEGQTVQSAYVNFNRPADESMGFNYLALCQTADSLSRGQYNDTDTVARNIDLKSLLLKLTGTVSIAGTPTAVTELIPIDVSDWATAKFVNRVFAGNTQEMELNFSTSEIYLRAGMTKLDGTTSQILAQLGGNRVAFTMKCGMIMKLDEGNLYQIDHNPTSLKILKVIDGANNQLASSDAGYQAAAALLVTPAVNFASPTISCVGFKLEAFRTNANNRTQGMILDDQTWKGVLTAKIQSSIGAIFPLDNPTLGINSSSQVPDALTKLLVATKALTEQTAIQKLFDIAARIKELQTRGDCTIYNHGGFTVGAQLVNPVIDDRGDVAISTIVKTLDSNNTLDNLSAGLINYLRAAIVDLETNSRFVVINKLYNGDGAKLKVTIGTSNVIAHWLSRVGDLRKLGLDDDKYEVEIVETYNTQMIDTVFITIHGGNANGSFNPTAFGHNVWAPEIVANYQKTDSNTVSAEMRVQPCFELYPNLPILFKVRFPNFTSYFRQAQLYQVGTTAQ